MAVVSGRGFGKREGTYFEIFDEPLQEPDKVLGSPDVSRDSVFEEVIGQYCQSVSSGCNTKAPEQTYLDSP